MMSITSTRYLSNVDWLQDVVQGTDLILCGVSALEYLELFNGYVNESKIQVYAQNEGQFDNIFITSKVVALVFSMPQADKNIKSRPTL